MIPKMIVALGESMEAVETSIELEVGSVDSDLKERKRLLRIRFDIAIDGNQVMSMSKLDIIIGIDPASKQIKKATRSCYLN
jgi:hypothetical protein